MVVISLVRSISSRLAKRLPVGMLTMEMGRWMGVMVQLVMAVEKLIAPLRTWSETTLEVHKQMKKLKYINNFFLKD